MYPVYVCVNVHACICTSTYMCRYACICMRIYICMYDIHTYLSIYLHMIIFIEYTYIYIYIFVYAHTYACIFITHVYICG